MGIKELLKKIRYYFHRDFVWKDYERDFVIDSPGMTALKSYVHNQYLIGNLGMGVKELPEYKYYRKIHDLTKVYRISDTNYVLKRVGKDDNGGYVMAYPFS